MHEQTSEASFSPAPGSGRYPSAHCAGGTGGIAITDFGTGADEITALAAQGDKVVAAGSIYTSLGLARYVTR
jgi:hypothetical protein